MGQRDLGEIVESVDRCNGQGCGGVASGGLGVTGLEVTNGGEDRSNGLNEAVSLSGRHLSRLSEQGSGPIEVAAPGVGASQGHGLGRFERIIGVSGLVERRSDVARGDEGHDRQGDDQTGFVVVGFERSRSFQACLGVSELPGEQRDPSTDDHRPGVFVGKRAEPVDLVADGAELSAIHQFGGFVVDQISGLGEFAGGDVVLHCRVGIAFTLMPSRGSAVDGGEVGCLVRLRAGADRPAGGGTGTRCRCGRDR